MDSCLAVHAQFTKGVYPDIAPLLDTVLGLHEEVSNTGAEWSLVAEITKPSDQGTFRSQSVGVPWQEAQTLVTWFEEFDDKFLELLHVRATKESSKSNLKKSNTFSCLLLVTSTIPPEILRRYRQRI